MADVALVSMPFSLPDMPSLGLSLLKASLKLQGVSAKVFYPALWFAAQSRDSEAVWRIAQNARDGLAGEWIFAEAVFGHDSERDQAYIQCLLENDNSPWASDSGQPVADARLLRSEVSAFLDTCMAKVNWGQFRVVGFTTTFHQTLPSIALANRIKDRYPHVTIAFGGANCEGEMGLQLLRSFECIDLVCVGEGDRVFPEAVSRILQGIPVGEIPGLIHRDALATPYDLGGEAVRPDVVRDLDLLPYPDFSDFIESYTASGFEAKIALPFETSRGCWWGAKNPCRFCGQNGSKSGYRSKTPERALAEIRHLAETYGAHAPAFQATDTILDYRYLDTLLPDLCSLNLTRDMFYEVKANLTEDQVRALAEARVTRVQAGIESLSSSILRLMNKGVSTLQCVQLLKWAQQYGVLVNWNVIVAFPGEQESEYTAMANLVPYLTHLIPPVHAGPVRFDRFSAYFDAPAQYGIQQLEPKPVYYQVFRGLPKDSVRNIAYYFDGQYDQRNTWVEYAAPLFRAIESWKEEYQNSKLYSFLVEEDVLYVQDTRSAASATHHLLTGIDRLVLEATHRISSESPIAKYVEEQMGRRILDEEIRDSLIRLETSKLIISEDERYLSLVVPLTEKDLTDQGKAYMDHVRRIVCTSVASA